MMVMPAAALAALTRVGMLFSTAQFARFALDSATCRNPLFPLQRKATFGGHTLKKLMGTNWFCP